MPAYDGYYYYINGFDDVVNVLYDRGKYIPGYKDLYGTGLPVSLTEERFPENDNLPIQMDYDQYLSDFPNADEHYMLYTQDKSMLDKIKQGNVTQRKGDIKVKVVNGVEYHSWVQSDGLTGKNIGIIVVYDPDCRLTNGKRIPVWAIALIAVAIISIVAAAAAVTVFNRWISEAHALERHKAELEAARQVNITPVGDPNNPDGFLFTYSNGTSVFYNRKTGTITKTNEGVPWSNIFDSSKPPGAKEEETKQEALKTLIYVVGGVTVLAIVLFLVYAFIKARSGEKVQVKEIITKPVEWGKRAVGKAVELGKRGIERFEEYQ